MQHRVGDAHQGVAGAIEALHPAAGDDDLGLPCGEREAPQVLAPALLGREQQRAAVVVPLQRRVHVVVPVGALHRPLAARALPHGELARRGVLLPLLAGDEGDGRAVGVVARRLEVPVGVERDDAVPAALQLDLGQRMAVVEPLLLGRVEGEDDAPAVGRDVEGVDVGVGARQREAAALEQVAQLAGARVEHVQVRLAAHRQLAVPEAVLRLAGDVAAFLALLECLQPLRLRLGAAQLRPDPGDEGDAPAVGKPAEGLDAGGDARRAPRLAAVGRDQVELRLFVLPAFLFAPGGEGDQLAGRAPARLAVLLAAMRQRARLAAERGEQPQRTRGLVLVHREARQRGHRLRAVGREADPADALDAPQLVDADRLLAGHALSPSWWVVAASQRGRASCHSRCAFTAGHSSAVML